MNTKGILYCVSAAATFSTGRPCRLASSKAQSNECCSRSGEDFLLRARRAHLDGAEPFQPIHKIERDQRLVFHDQEAPVGKRHLRLRDGGGLRLGLGRLDEFGITSRGFLETIRIRQPH